MFPFELPAERKILDAMVRGEFDNLPGALRKRPVHLEAFPRYRERILEKMRG